MNTDPTSSIHSPSIEQGMQTMVRDVRAKASGKLETYESKIRQSPDKAMLIALAAGYCLHVLPVGRLISLPLRLTTLLVKPALLALGAVKLCEVVQEQARK